MSNLKNQLAERAQNGSGEGLTINALMQKKSVHQRFEQILGERAPGFMSSIINVVSGNNQLKKCDPNQIVAAAAIAATLDLPIDPNLGFAYIVPYGNKPQFQIGYKGFIQLGMRTAMYQTMNVDVWYEGELVEHNRFKGDVIFDESKRESDVVEGCVAYFRLINGFEKYLIMTLPQIHDHAKKFSKSYNNSNSAWKTNTRAMELKTPLRLLLSKWGILSIQMQTALKADQAVITEGEDGNAEFDYPDGKTVDGEYSVSDEDGPTVDVEDDPTLSPEFKTLEEEQGDLKGGGGK